MGLFVTRDRRNIRGGSPTRDDDAGQKDDPQRKWSGGTCRACLKSDPTSRSIAEEGIDAIR